VYNIAYGKSVTVNEMFNTIRNLLSGYDVTLKLVEPTYSPERPGDVKFSLADISRAKEQLGYKPEFDFELGMKKAVEWYWGNFK
jgi:nucleoside-diphosphate-sugar epimerase